MRQCLLVPGGMLQHPGDPDVPVPASLATNVQVRFSNSNCVCIGQTLHLIKAMSSAQHIAVVNESSSANHLEMSVAELFPNENCPRPGTDPGKCSSDNLFSRSWTSRG